MGQSREVSTLSLLAMPANDMIEVEDKTLPSESMSSLYPWDRGQGLPSPVCLPM